VSKRLPRDRIIRAIADSRVMADWKAAEANNIGLSTLRRYRARMPESALNKEIDRLLGEDAARDWGAELEPALRAAVSFILEANEQLNPKDYRAVNAVTRAFQTLIECKIILDGDANATVKRKKLATSFSQ
jgi:hypothetical protein